MLKKKSNVTLHKINFLKSIKKYTQNIVFKEHPVVLDAEKNSYVSNN